MERWRYWACLLPASQRARLLADADRGPPACLPALAQVKALEGHRVVEGSCGGTHTMVVTAEGRCFIWGRGSFGRLGTGGERDCPAPVEVKLPGGPERWRIITAAAGGRHSLVLALPDNGGLEARQADWEARKPLYSSPSPPRSTLDSVGLERELERSWAAEADDEAEDGGEWEEGPDAADKPLCPPQRRPGLI